MSSPLEHQQDAFDVVVIGGGPGGYVAAIRAAQHGLRAAVVERAELGGVCANWGCIPTKAMLHGADVAHAIDSASALGFTVGEVGFDMAGLVAFSRSVVSRLTGGIAGLLAANGVEVVAGTAFVPAKGQVRVTGADGAERTLRADHIVVATGARPRSIPGVQPDGERIWTSTDALRPAALPASLLVIGSGAIGVEFASLYRDLGSEVTIVEAAPSIMPLEDAEVSAFVQKRFEARGMRVESGAKVVSVTPHPDRVETTFLTAAGAEVTVVSERVLVATGIAANSEGLGLEELGATIARGFVTTDEWCRTGVAGIYAIGDVAGGPCLAHKASHEAVICIDRIAGEPHVRPLDRDYVPGCTYSRPQVASLGLTEQQARERGAAISIGRFDLTGNGKALALGDANGFVKTIFDASTGELLGAHLVGPEVTEMIQGLDIAHTLEATAETLAEVVFAHPTVSESIHESVLDSLGKAIHWPPRKAAPVGASAGVS